MVDTTGAGDGFVAGLLTGILDQMTPGWGLETLPERKLKQIARYANAVGALTCTQKGAIPALPSGRQVEKYLANSK